MDITTTTDGEHPLLTLAGRFDAFETEAFRAGFNDLFAGDAKSIAVDLHGVQFIDSAALAELVRAMKHCREAKGELILQRLSDPVRIILELTGLHAAFEIRES